MKHVLITGAAGNLGGKLAAHLQGRYTLHLLDRVADAERQIVEADLSQWQEAWVKEFEGVDTVVHLAANPDPTPAWAALLASNLDAVVNVFTAAACAGVKRLIFASSNHAMGQYKDIDEPVMIDESTEPRPGTRWEQDDEIKSSTPYGALKLAGERIGKCFADAYPMQFIAVRIGWVMAGENDGSVIGPAAGDWLRLMWLSNRDYCQLMERAIAADLGQRKMLIVNGMSNNSGMRWDLRAARTILGYEPQDDVTKA